MGLPVSGFPNMNAVSLEDATGQNYVDTLDFLKVWAVAFVRGKGARSVTSVAAHHAVVQNCSCAGCRSLLYALQPGLGVHGAMRSA